MILPTTAGPWQDEVVKGWLEKSYSATCPLAKALVVNVVAGVEEPLRNAE